jgi:hypothetical protein
MSLNKDNIGNLYIGLLAWASFLAAERRAGSHFCQVQRRGIVDNMQHVGKNRVVAGETLLTALLNRGIRAYIKT